VTEKKHPMHHRDIVKMWSSCAELARDLARAGKAITPMGVARWAQRNRLPAEWWEAVTKAGQQRGFLVTVGLLSRIAARRPRRRYGAVSSGDG
jgi:hypothetical protein